MKAIEGLFVVGGLLFVCGVGLVVVGARSVRRVEAPPPAPPVAKLASVATVKQIMRSIVDPAAETIFQSVSTTITRLGIEEKAPRTQDDWESVGAGAAALAEAGQLMMIEARAVDRQDWMRMSQSMIDAARVTMKAVTARDAKALFDAGGEVYVSCESCHSQYMR